MGFGSFCLMHNFGIGFLSRIHKMIRNKKSFRTKRLPTGCSEAFICDHCMGLPHAFTDVFVQKMPGCADRGGLFFIGTGL